MKLKLSKLLIVLLFLSSSCANLFQDNKPSTRPIDYIAGAKKLDFKKFFDGSVDGFSIIKDQDDNIIDTKKILIDGEWEGNKGIIKQRYENRKGKKDSRTWLVTMHKDGTFDAVGHDISAPALGKQIHNSAQITYQLRVKRNGVRQEVFFEDRMYQIDSDSMIIITNFKNLNPDHSEQVRDNYGQIITSLHKVYDYEDSSNSN